MLKGKKQKTQKGFSLLEVLISVFVLTAGIATVSSLMTKNIKNTTSARKQIVADQLMQEGVELVRNLKDNGTDLSALQGSSYTIGYDSALAAMGAFSTTQLYNKPLGSGGYFTHSAAGNTASRFYRKVTLENDGQQGTRVTCVVVWDANSFPATCNLATNCVSVVADLL